MEERKKTKNPGKWESYKATEFKSPAGKKALDGYKYAMHKKKKAGIRQNELWYQIYLIMEDYVDKNGMFIIDKSNRDEILRRIHKILPPRQKDKVSFVFKKFIATMISRGDSKMMRLTEARALDELFWGLDAAKAENDFGAHRGYNRDLMEVLRMFPEKGSSKVPEGAKSLTFYSDGKETGIIATGKPGEGIALVREMLRGEQGGNPIPQEMQIEEKKEIIPNHIVDMNEQRDDI